MTIEQWGVVASIVSAITSLIGILFVVVQLRLNNRIAKAQLINELERDISVHAKTLTQLTIGSDNWTQSKTALTEEQQIEILNCISFFERVHEIINTKVLDIQSIDDIFGGRFFSLYENHKVKDFMETSQMRIHLNSISTLHQKWSQYRRNKTRRKSK